MFVNPITYFSIAGALFTVAIAFIVVVVIYIKTEKKLKRFQKHASITDEAMQKKSLKIIEESREKAFKIIEDANTKAREILKNAATVTDNSKGILNKQLDKVYQKQSQDLQKTSNDLLSAYKELLEETKRESINTVKNISKSIEVNALSEVEDFKEVLKQQTISSQKVVAEKIQSEYDTAEKAVNDYKAQKLKEIDDSIFSLLNRVSEETIGKTLSLEQHEELVLEALEKAKKEMKL